jgi:hypothetical protein
LRHTRLGYLDPPMLFVLYLPQGAEPEAFGPYSTPQAAVNALRRIAAAAGHPLNINPSALMASIDLTIEGERHRYQLLKMASTSQLDVHVTVIDELRHTIEIKVTPGADLAPPARFSGY